MNQLPNCPVEIVMMFLKDRIGVLIIGYLLQEQLTAESLQKRVGNISFPVLIQRLNEMEEKEIIRKTTEETLSKSKVYSLTAFGRSFNFILSEMERWGKNAQGIV